MQPQTPLAETPDSRECRGRIHVDGDRAGIAFDRHLSYPAAAVWRAVTDPAALSAWLGETSISDGEVTICAGPGHVPPELRRTTGPIVENEPERVFAFAWRQPIVEASTVRFALEPQGEDETVLRLTHEWLTLRNAEGFLPGWHAYLDRLEAWLGDRTPPDWMRRYAEVRSFYE